MAFAMDPPYCVAYSADYKTNDPTQMTPHVTHTPPICHDNQQYDSEETAVFTSLGANGQEGDQRWSPSHPKRRALRPCTVSGNSHTAEPRGSTCRSSHAAGSPISDRWTLLSRGQHFPQFPRGSRIVYC